MMLIVTLIGFGVTVSSVGGIQVSSSFRTQQRAFQVAEAGLEHGKEHARYLLCCAPPCCAPLASRKASYDEMLTDAANGGGLLNPTRLANFGGTTGIVNHTTNTPFVGSTQLDAFHYQTFITNDPEDGPTSTDDTNRRIMLTSFASGPESVGFAVVQAVYERPDVPTLPSLPALISMPGPDAVVDPFNSRPAEMNGNGGNEGCWGTIGLTSQHAVNSVETALSSVNRTSQYHTCDPGGGPDLSGVDTVENFLEAGPSIWDNPYEPGTTNTPLLKPGDRNLIDAAWLDGLVTGLAGAADFTSESDPGFNLGSPSDPRIVVINGDLQLSGTGAGILAVTGELTMLGNFSYTGVIYAIGEGRVIRNGGGNGEMFGGMLIADTVNRWDGCYSDGTCNPALADLYVGVAEYRHNGGGISLMGTNDHTSGGGLGTLGAPLRRVSFQQLR